jgi:hypothetical protein
VVICLLVDGDGSIRNTDHETMASGGGSIEYVQSTYPEMEVTRNCAMYGNELKCTLRVWKDKCLYISDTIYCRHGVCRSVNMLVYPARVLTFKGS